MYTTLRRLSRVCTSLKIKSDEAYTARNFPFLYFAMLNRKRTQGKIEPFLRNRYLRATIDGG